MHGYISGIYISGGTVGDENSNYGIFSNTGTI